MCLSMYIHRAILETAPGCTTGVAKHCRGVLGALQQLDNAGAHAPYLDRDGLSTVATQLPQVYETAVNYPIATSMALHTYIKVLLLWRLNNLSATLMSGRIISSLTTLP
jgi:hypothetical protein